jgi:hypothetical protein
MKSPNKIPVIAPPVTGMSESLHQTRSELVGVIRAVREYRLVAIHPIPAGERLFRIEGELTTTPTRYSVQIGENLHIDLGSGHSAEEILDRYFWRFMNHSCEPNSLIRDREVIAKRDIQPWEAVTFNYNTTEWDMAEPFSCGCGSENCLGIVQGLKYLTISQRERLGTVAPHLSHHVFDESRIIAELSQA